MPSTGVEDEPIPRHTMVQCQVLGSDASRGVSREPVCLSSLVQLMYPVLYTCRSSAVTSLGVRSRWGRHVGHI